MSIPDGEAIDFDNWQHMAVGETGTMYAVIVSFGYGAPGTVVVRKALWAIGARMVLTCDLPRDTKMIPLKQRTRIRVKRLEHGLQAITIWAGDVPIPLVAGDTP